MTAGAVVFGIGNEDRGDDGVGPAVARALRDRAVPGLRVVSPAQPLDLLDLALAAEVVAVVDAVCSGRPPGTVMVLEVQHQALPGWATAAGSHAVGLDAVVELLQALGRQPRRLVLVGVEAATFHPGAPLSGPVRAAVPTAASAVQALVELPARGER
jgi:hydrogenase maturation protease